MSSHWLMGVARRANLSGTEDLDVPADTPTAEAWRIVSEASGLDAGSLAEVLAKIFSLDSADLDAAARTATRLIPGDLARRFHVMPLRDMERQIVIATANPTDLEAEQAVAFASGRTAVMQIASPTAIAQAIDAAYAPDKAIESLLETVDGGADRVIELVQEEDVGGPDLQPEELAGGPVVRLTNIIFTEADRLGASDVHIQPAGSGGVVRFRVDGVLRQGMSMPLPVLARVVSRVKIMAQLDIADRLRPQDGRARIDVGRNRYDLRISTVPANGTEKAVIRLLPEAREFSLTDVGMEDEDREAFTRLVKHREGIVLVTGPTGSGKTTTLYAALQQIATDDVNVMTVEDPVEYQVAGLTQIQVEKKQNVTFASALRAILRQDPDVIFVGEIRDGETAEMAAQASLTGHLVLSTLHTNDAVGAVRRLADLGLDLATVSETLRGVVAQRLVRTVCADCAVKLEGTLPAEQQALAERFGVSPKVTALGCESCGQTGYKGRKPLLEVFTVTPKIAAMINDGASHGDLQAAALAQGMRSLQDAGVRRVAAGETTLEEVERVLGDLSGPRARRSQPRAAEVAGRGPEAPTPDTASPSASVGGFAATPPPAGPTAPGSASAANPATAAPGPPTGATPAAMSPAAGSQEPAPGSNGGAPSILVVDDDPASRFLVGALLERGGFSVSEHDGGASALEALGRSSDFSLMVLDLDMPDMGGREVLAAVRSRAETATLPVIILTASLDEGADIELIEAGADDYLQKPVDPHRLLTRVKATLRRQTWDTVNIG